jgi:HAD superfamily hydrolase (TIGR01493 family)
LVFLKAYVGMEEILELETDLIDLNSIDEDFDALIFDCDGTLVDTLPAYAAAWAEGFYRSGHAMQRDWYFSRAGMSEDILLDEFERENRVNLNRQQIVSAMRAYFLKNLNAVERLNTVCELVAKYHGVLPLAVASGGSRAIVRATLEAVDLTRYFDHVVTIDDTGTAKPDPGLFLTAASRMKIDPDRCLVFEDSEQGFEAARRAGMSAVNVRELI